MPADELIHSLLSDRNPQSVEDYKEIADSLRRLPEAEACTIQVAIKSMEISQFYRSGLKVDSDRLDGFQVSDSCQNLSARYHFQLGAIRFKAGNIRGAIDEFQRSLQLTSDSTFRGDAHNNLSACYAATELELDSALLHLEWALRLLDKAHSPYILNNLIAIALRQGDWIRARSYLQQAVVLSDGAQPDLVYNLHMNALTLELIEGNLGQAQVALDYVLAHPPSPGNECEALRQISRGLLLTQDYARYVENYHWLQGFASSCATDSSNVYAEEAIAFQPWRYRMDLLDSIAEPLDEVRWRMASWTARTLVPNIRDGHQQSAINALFPPTESPPSNTRWGIWALIGLLSVCIFFLLLGRKAVGSPSARAIQRQFDQLKKVAEMDPHHEVIQQEILRLEAAWRKGQAPLSLLGGEINAELSRLEEKVLEQLALGRSSKEIAHILSISPGYVYNVRMKLRKKLNIPDDLRFEDWLDGQGE